MMRTALYILVGLALAGFVAANWVAFNTATVLTLGVVDFTAPLGLLMLLVLGVVAVMFLATLALWQSRILADSRRHARELAEHRALASTAEASRLGTLRGQIVEDLKRLEARIDAAETGLRADFHDGINSLAAMVGEMDDRLATEGPVDESTQTLPPGGGSRH